MAMLPACKGLVCEEGGILTAAATTARELGIPVVVGAAQASRAILTGDRVRVDGDCGLVILLRTG
jgi:pyruvate,water dikinase